MTQMVLSILSIAILFGLLIPVSIIDIKRRVIPNGFSVAVAASGLALWAAKTLVNRPGWREYWSSAIFGLLIGAGVCVLCRLIVKEGIGLGDVKLMLALGLYQGMLIFPQMLAVSSLAALVAAVVVKIRTRSSVKGTRLPFAPFLSAGAVTAQILGEFL